MAELAYKYENVHEPILFTQLTAAATATTSIDLRSEDKMYMYKNILFQITVAGITTNVIVRGQGSLDDENWFNLDEDEMDVTYTANGTYSVRYEGDGEVRYARLYWVSESGGTAATLDVKAFIF